MPNDRQLNGVLLADVVEKRRLGQALSAKEFAVLVGISYSTAREWFHSERFPVFRGKVFWQDFVQWRKAEIGLRAFHDEDKTCESKADASTERVLSSSAGLPARASRILSEAM